MRRGKGAQANIEFPSNFSSPHNNGLPYTGRTDPPAPCNKKGPLYYNKRLRHCRCNCFVSWLIAANSPRRPSSPLISHEAAEGRVRRDMPKYRQLHGAARDVSPRLSPNRKKRVGNLKQSLPRPEMCLLHCQVAKVLLCRRMRAKAS